MKIPNLNLSQSQNLRGSLGERERGFSDLIQWKEWEILHPNDQVSLLFIGQ